MQQSSKESKDLDEEDEDLEDPEKKENMERKYLKTFLKRSPQFFKPLYFKTRGK